MIAPEFSRPWRLDQIGAGETSADLSATPEECAALAKRFGLIAVDRLEARFKLRRDVAGIVAHGHLSAAVTQACVVTEEPIPAVVEEDFALRFLPEPDAPEDEVELGEEEMDTIFYTGGAIDLGEAAAETLALSLDPFPRSAEATKALREAGVLTEEEAGPFNAFAALKEQLEKKK